MDELDDLTVEPPLRTTGSLDEMAVKRPAVGKFQMVLWAIVNFQRRYGRPPRLQDLKEMLGLPMRAHVQYYVRKLRELGLMMPKGLLTLSRPGYFSLGLLSSDELEHELNLMMKAGKLEGNLKLRLELHLQTLRMIDAAFENGAKPLTDLKKFQMQRFKRGKRGQLPQDHGHDDP